MSANILKRLGRRTNSMMVTVLFGLLSGRGCISMPFPPKMLSNSADSKTSSNLMVFEEPWNLTESDLHSFFSLLSRLEGDINR